jgi:hypothetical protein
MCKPETKPKTTLHTCTHTQNGGGILNGHRSQLKEFLVAKIE